MFRDECQIDVQAGKGGDGIVSFRREKFVPKGGPDGGNGGDGGDVVLIAHDRVTSLLSLGRRPRYRAQDGRAGGSWNKTGASGDSCVLEVPVGTQVFDAEHGNLLRDLAEPAQELVVAAGGRGGRGNASFASSVRQAPRKAEPGRAGEHRLLRLELKIVAEVGLIGLPNAGKSTLLSTVSRARPKIAAYPFTTLSPIVGIAPLGELETLVIADLPGLIEGAAEGAGLGHRFLRHVERCRVLLQLVDVSDGATTPPAEAWRVVDEELRQYSEVLFARPRLLVATKVEDEAAEARALALAEDAGAPLVAVSSQTGKGLPDLLRRAHALVHSDDA